MSAANCPETPRQKMISMMYLFLTAMLAVNVSSTVLDSFEKVDISLRNNNEIISNNNTSAYTKLKTEYKKNNIKFGDAFEKSEKIRANADSLFAQIEGYKWDLARQNDGEEGDPYNLKGKDNIDIGHAVMVFKIKPGKPSKSEILKESINNYREFLLNEVIVDTAEFKTLTQAFIKSLNTNDPTKQEEKNSHGGDHQKWEDGIFTNIPIGAIMPLLTKLQTDIRNTESMALAHLLSQATASDFKVNDIQAHLILSSNLIFKGSKMTAKALLAATDSTQKPRYELFVNGKPIEGNADGFFEINTSSTGTFEITGNIISKNEDGTDNALPFEAQEYVIEEPIATVSATKMNVLYAGVDNPMSVSVPGFSSKDIKPSFSDGSSLISSGSGYTAKPKTPGKEINMIVSAMIDGTWSVVGTYPFRVKALPPPTAYVRYPKEIKVNGKKTIQNEDFATGRLKKKDLLNAEGVIAKLLDSDFIVQYNILGFDMTFYDSMGNAKTYSSSSSKFTSDQINRIKSLTRGKQFFITNIQAKGPDGIPRRLPAIDITIN